MADSSDVESSLVTLIGSILYPSGPGGNAVTGSPINIYRGFPNPAQLDKDLKLGVSHITVYEQAGFTRLTGGYLDQTTNTPGVATIFATVTGEVVTLTGAPAVGQLVGVAALGQAYVYACQAGDTLTAVAAAVVALINAASGWPLTSDIGGGITDYSGDIVTTEAVAVANGATITVATFLPIQAATAALGTSVELERWQLQGFRITVWTPTPAIRDAICKYLDNALSKTRFLALPDGQGARLEWRNTYSDDCPQKEQLWKRDLFYTVQFATSTVTQIMPSLFPASINTTKAVFG